MANYGRPGVYITERLLPAPIAVAGTAEAAGAILGHFPQGAEDVTLITSWYDFTKKFGGYNNAYPATFGIGQFFQNGGTELYVKRVLASDAAASAVTVPASNVVGDSSSVLSKNKGADGNNLRVQFTETAQANYFDLTVYKETVAGTGSNTANDIILERYTNVVFNNANSGDFVETVVNLQSDYIQVFVSNTAAAPSLSVLPLIGGTDGTAAPTDVEFSAAVDALSAIDRPLVVFLPGLIDLLGAADAAGVYNSAISWAEDNNGFVIVETDEGLSVSEALTAAGTISDSSHAAVYYPHVYITDPLGRSPQSIRKVGPSGSVAGLFLSTDRAFGPFKAPAGTRASVSALALEKAFTSAELDLLNANSSPVNALRNLPGAGVVVMGARTLLQDGTANKYVNMRRSLIYIKKQLNDLTQFALFENNDEVLWARLRTVIGVFLNDYRSIGGLRGATEGEAFFIKVDAENNPQNSIQLGEVHIEVGVALQYPAEFVVINLSQKTAS